MKYAVAGVAIVAAVAALFFRPPHGGPAMPSAESTPAVAAIGSVSAASPFASVRPSLASRVVVYVAGEVRTPGVYTLPSNARAGDALARAGGPLADADLVAVNLAARLSDGDEVAVPKVGATTTHSQGRRHSTKARVAHRPRRHSRARGARTGAVAPEPLSIDLNTASVHDLEGVPGIGPGLAERIVTYRETNGPFASIDELADVAGITPRLQDSLAGIVVIR